MLFLRPYVILQYHCCSPPPGTSWVAIRAMCNFGTASFFALGPIPATFLMLALQGSLSGAAADRWPGLRSPGVGIGYLTLRLKGVFCSRLPLWR